MENGDHSNFKDFFIDWNDLWQGNGEMDETGVIIPKPEHLEKLFMRKPGLPILKVPFPNGSKRPYWNTFYQEVIKEKTAEGNFREHLLGQMDLNACSEAVWRFYDETLSKLKDYGGGIIRLDAFAYLHKEVGSSNFFNVPGTWKYLERLKKMADRKGLMLLPEIHAEYGSGLHESISKEGYLIYDFFLPGLVLYAIEFSSNKALLEWATEILDKGLKTINMLGCHDGIPLLDLKGKEIDGIYRKGLLSDDEIEELMDLILSRGGRVKNLYGPSGKKVSYYQVNATYYSALGEDPRKLLLARAIQVFMPGTPQIWYLDLFAGTNDYEAADKLGEGGHKEINRTNLSDAHIESMLDLPVVRKQLELIRLRNTCKAFNGEMRIMPSKPHEVNIHWENNMENARMSVNLKTFELVIEGISNGKNFRLDL